MSGIDRRAVIGAGAAMLIAGPVGAWSATDDDRLRAVLDGLPRGDPAVALAALSGFSASRLSLGPALDLRTISAGLAIDVELGRRFAGRTTGPVADPDHYLLLLRRRLGNNVSLATARHRLTRELRRLTHRADMLFRRIGSDRGNTGTRYAALFGDTRYHYSDDEAGRDRAVADMNQALAGRHAAAHADFPNAPAWCFDAAVRRTTRADEASGKSGRRELPLPSKPGAYYVDLAGIERRPAWTLPSVVAHELLPGHMIQLPIEAAADLHPLRIGYASAFPEGWAVYAEQLAAGEGAFAQDPRAELGHVHWLLFRIGRALADLLLHLDRQSLEQVCASLVEWQGEPAYFASFDRDLARIATEPTARLAEALCWLDIRDHAPTEAAARRLYHHRLLRGGRTYLKLA